MLALVSILVAGVSALRLGTLVPQGHAADDWAVRAFGVDVGSGNVSTLMPASVSLAVPPPLMECTAALDRHHNWLIANPSGALLAVDVPTAVVVAHSNTTWTLAASAYSEHTMAVDAVGWNASLDEYIVSVYAAETGGVNVAPISSRLPHAHATLALCCAAALPSHFAYCTATHVVAWNRKTDTFAPHDLPLALALSADPDPAAPAFWVAAWPSQLWYWPLGAAPFQWTALAGASLAQGALWFDPPTLLLHALGTPAGGGTSLALLTTDIRSNNSWHVPLPWTGANDNGPSGLWLADSGGA